jgi:hypothetical protein
MKHNERLYKAIEDRNLWEKNLEDKIGKILQVPVINYKNDFKTLNQQILKTAPHSLIEQKTQETITEITKVKEVLFDKMESIQVLLTQLNYDKVIKEVMSIKIMLTNNTKCILEDSKSNNQSNYLHYKQ